MIPCGHEIKTARALDRKTLEAAARRAQHGEGPEVVARIFGAGRTAIERWLAHNGGGAVGDALKAEPVPGRPRNAMAGH